MEGLLSTGPTPSSLLDGRPGSLTRVLLRVLHITSTKVCWPSYQVAVAEVQPEGIKVQTTVEGVTGGPGREAAAQSIVHKVAAEGLAFGFRLHVPNTGLLIRVTIRAGHLNSHI